MQELSVRALGSFRTSVPGLISSRNVGSESHIVDNYTALVLEPQVPSRKLNSEFTWNYQII